jgi:hypothetical protein
VRPVRVRPAESRVTAFSATEAPSRSAAVVGDTTTVATGTGCTETAAVPRTPSTVAVIVALPAAMPLTTPVPFTVATVAAEVVHCTVRPVSVTPVESRICTASGVVAPTRIVVVAGVTRTSATARGATITGTRTDLPPALAATCAEPREIPVTIPPWVTVMMLASETDQNSGRESGVPAASKARADSPFVSSTSSVNVDGVASMRATPDSPDVADSAQESRPDARTRTSAEAVVRRGAKLLLAMPLERLESTGWDAQNARRVCARQGAKAAASRRYPGLRATRVVRRHACFANPAPSARAPN